MLLLDSEAALGPIVCCRVTGWWGEEVSTRIHSLEGLQFATNLISLNVSADMWSHDGSADPQLSSDIDFSPLGSRTKLETLNLAFNWLSHSSVSLVLANLIHLPHLDLGWNLLPDASFLKNLTELRSLPRRRRRMRISSYSAFGIVAAPWTPGRAHSAAVHP